MKQKIDFILNEDCWTSKRNCYCQIDKIQEDMGKEFLKNE